MEEFAIGANLESAAARRNERERLDALAEFENFGRQTDGLRRVVSNDAVFDRYLGFHLELLSKNQAIGTSKRGQDSVEVPDGFEVTFLPQPIAFSDGHRPPLQETLSTVAHGRRRFSSFRSPRGRTTLRKRRTPARAASPPCSQRTVRHPSAYCLSASTRSLGQSRNY
jgi:hypothetical protein